MRVSAIYTAAMEMLGGGEAVKSQCRRPEIVADAAYTVLTSDSRKYTGHFDIDEDVLRRNGVTDFQKYSYHQGKHWRSSSRVVVVVVVTVVAVVVVVMVAAAAAEL